MGLIGGSSKTKKTSISVSDVKEQNVGVEAGDVGAFVSPGGALTGTGGGSVHANPYSTVTQNISTTRTGFEFGDVQGLIDSIFESQEGERDTMAGVAGSLAVSTQESQKQLGRALEETRAPEATQLTQLMPLALLVGVVLMLAMLGGRK